MSEVIQYKCPCCGGAVEFNSEIQEMKCPYCDTQFAMDVIKEYNEEINKKDSEAINWAEYNKESGSGEWQEKELENLTAYICQSCGGEIITSNETGAMRCPYCDNTVVVLSKFEDTFRPDYILPFKLDKAKAEEAYANHLKGKRLAPKLFKEQNHIEEIKGIYVPFWLYNCDANGSASYQATRVRMWSDHSYEYSETSYYQVLRSGKMQFEKIPADASKKMPDDLMDSLEPYDYSELVDFDTAYMAGYLADKYDVTADENIPRVNERIKTTLASELRKSVDYYSTITQTNLQVNSENGDISYVLLPVWLLNTTYKGEKYIFGMNGQNGKFVGNIPMDKGIFWRWFGGIFGGCLAAGSIIATLVQLI